MACLCEQMVDDASWLSPTCIGHLWIFQDLAPAELEALASRAVRRKLSRGETLFMQGDPAGDLFLIKGGRIKLSKVLEEGSEITLDIRKAGAVLVGGYSPCGAIAAFTKAFAAAGHVVSPADGATGFKILDSRFKKAMTKFQAPMTKQIPI